MIQILIKNYFMMSNKKLEYKSFPRVYTKWKWLSKPLNWLLKLANAQEEITTQTWDRVEVNERELMRKIQLIMYHQRNHGLCPDKVILGFDQWNGIITSSESIHLNVFLGEPVKKLCGLEVILSPYIDGIVII